MRTECNMQRELLLKYCEDEDGKEAGLTGYPRGNKL